MQRELRLLLLLVVVVGLQLVFGLVSRRRRQQQCGSRRCMIQLLLWDMGATEFDCEAVNMTASEKAAYALRHASRRAEGKGTCAAAGFRFGSSRPCAATLTMEQMSMGAIVGRSAAAIVVFCPALRPGSSSTTGGPLMPAAPCRTEQRQGVWLDVSLWCNNDGQ